MDLQSGKSTWVNDVRRLLPPVDVMYIVAIRFDDESIDRILVVHQRRRGPRDPDTVNTWVDAVLCRLAPGRKLTVRHDTCVAVEPVSLTREPLEAAHGFIRDDDATFGPNADGPTQLFDARTVAITSGNTTHRYHVDGTVAVHGPRPYTYRMHGVGPRDGGGRSWGLLAIEAAKAGDVIALQSTDGDVKFTYRVVLGHAQ
jgi:hypothetical protein